jgi:hypothetical protein
MSERGGLVESIVRIAALSIACTRLSAVAGTTATVAMTTAAVAATAAPAAGAATQEFSAGLGNEDMAIGLTAGDSAPRLARLAQHGETPWINSAAEPAPELVEVAGRTLRLVWHFDRAASRIERRAVSFVYRTDTPRLRMIWAWHARDKRGPMEHTVRIENLSGETLWLPLLPSLRFAWGIDPRRTWRRFWIEKGADTPSAEGTHDDSLADGDRWDGHSSTYARPVPGESREMIPYLLVYQSPGSGQPTPGPGQPPIMGPAWYLGIEFSGRTHISLQRTGGSLQGEAGLNPAPGPYRTRLEPGGILTTPTVFLGAASGDPDAVGNTLRTWVREVLGNPRATADPQYPLLVSNSWGSGMAVDAALARRMIRDAQALGLEMFHLDAGWFRAVGDWRADPAKFPEGLRTLARAAHRAGLRFGLWVDWTQAGVSDEAGARRVDDPTTRDWLIADPPAGWRHAEPFKGITIDLGVPAAQTWAGAELERLVHDDDLDMLEHDGYLVAQGSTRADHPAAPPDPATLRVSEDSGYVWVDGSNATDVSYYATRAYYALYERLRRRHPRLLLEICNDGGRMVDFGSAAHGDYFSITDTYDPVANRRAFFDASHVLPPAMLETYVAAWPTKTLANFRYMLRSGMMGWFTLMQDTGKWTSAQRAAAIEEFSMYRRRLRPLIRVADLYHVSARPDGLGWDAIEYFTKTQDRGVLYAFRGSSTEDSAHRFPLRGLDSERRYRISFTDDASPGTARSPRATIMSGRELLEHGIVVDLAEPNSSALAFIDAVR